MSETKFDPKKFANYKFKAQDNLIKVLKPQGQAISSQRSQKKQNPIWDTFKVLAAAFIIAVVFRLFVVQTFYLPSDSMKPTLNVNERIIANKLSYGVGNPFWGTYDTPKLLYIIPNPLYKKAFTLSKRRYISNSRGPRRGDIIVYEDPSSGFYGIKRVIGLPREQVKVRKGVVYINGKELKEKYGVIKDDSNFGPVKVPADSYFLMGDNRPASSDSRMWGMLASNRIIGRVSMRIWPPAKIRVFK